MENFSESDFDLSQDKIIHIRPQNVEIYLVRKQNEQLVVKKNYFKSLDESNSLLKGIMAVSSLNHSSIAKFRSVFFGRSLNYLVTVMNYYADGNLEKEIAARTRTNTFLQENIIQKIIQDLVSGFMYMQQNNISHRDIRSKNILKVNNDYYITSFKYANYGESKYLVGNPTNFSPKLVEAYKKFTETKILPNFKHNVFKSDVFSLGLVLLEIACLKSLECKSNMTKNNFENLRDQIIESCNYSNKIKRLLMMMLEFDEDYRPDFIQLGQYLNNNDYLVKEEDLHIPIPVVKPINPSVDKTHHGNANQPFMAKVNYPQTVQANQALNIPKLHLPLPVGNNNFQDLKFCFVCDQIIGHDLDFITIKDYMVHSICLESSYKSVLEGKIVTEYLIKNNGNFIIVNNKQLELCSCGILTYIKPGISINYCLKCFLLWQIDIYSASRQMLFYKILSHNASEVIKDQICICYQRSVEVCIRERHLLCFKCIEEHVWPLFYEQVIYCPWQCCAMKFD